MAFDSHPKGTSMATQFLRTLFLAFSVILALTVSAPAAWSMQDAKEQQDAAQDGEADLEKATALKLNARGFDDLKKVIELCESALEKGLDADSQEFANELLAASLYQRAEMAAQFLRGQQGGRLSRRARALRDIAVEDLKKVVEKDKTYGEAYLLLAEMLSLPGGERQQAVDAVNQALKHFGNDRRKKSEALVMRARFYDPTKDDEREKMMADLDEAIQMNKENVAAIQMRAILLLDRQEFDKAVGDLKSLLERDSENIGFLMALAEALANLEKYDEAIEYTGKIIELVPERAFGYAARARFRLQAEDKEGALKDLGKALKLEPEDTDSLLTRARVHYTDEDFDKAQKDVDRALSVRAGNPEAILLRSAIYAAQAKFGLAIRDTNNLLQLNPDNIPLKVQLGLYHSADDRPRKAVEVFNEVLDKEAENISALRGRGDARLAIGEHGKAIDDYKSVLKLEPENSSVLNNYSWVLATSPDEEVRDGELSVELGLKACKLTEYKAAHILSTLAAGYAETGDYENAIKWATKAVELGKESSSIEQLKQELESYQKKEPWRERQNVEEKPLKLESRRIDT